MPELAEVALMGATVNAFPSHLFHTYTRSHVAKLGADLPIPRCWTTFRLQARSRGKELRVDLLPVTIDVAVRRLEERERSSGAAASSPTSSSSKETKKGRKKEVVGEGRAGRVHPPNPEIPLDGPLPLLFRMGMTGHFQCFSDPERTHKHAHLTFLSTEPSPLAVCFVDQRQFGRWLVTAEWDATRSPCLLTEYQLFRQHIVDAMEAGKRSLNKPLCEVLLDQTLFNGVGNYLRAEICHRAGINPFQTARAALEGVTLEERKGGEPDLLQVCHDVVQEVFRLGYRYSSPNNEREDLDDPESKESPAKVSRETFLQWLKCYERHDDGMVSTVDGKGRAMWHEKRWTQKGKTKAGPRRPKKGKTISGAQRGGDDESRTDKRRKKRQQVDEAEEEDAEEKEEADVQANVDDAVDDAEEATGSTARKAKKGRGKRAASGKAKTKGGRQNKKVRGAKPAEGKDEDGCAADSNGVDGVEDEVVQKDEGDVGAKDEAALKGRRGGSRGRRAVKAEEEGSDERKEVEPPKVEAAGSARRKRGRVEADGDAEGGTRRRSARLRG